MINTTYKNSPLGLIPEDWEVIEFGEFAERGKNQYLPKLNENLKCLELEHFEQGTGNILGYVNSSEQKSNKNKFVEGQVLFGKLRPYLKKYWLTEFEGVCSSEVWVLNSKSNKCTNEFIFRLVQSNRFIQVANVSSGSKMPRADWDYVSNFPFSIPPLPEQKAIADCLSTWDKAIEKLNALISQKELSKKALMQQLLSGKKRLKGFSGEWKEVRLGDLGDTYNGLTGKSKEDFGSGFPFITYMNIFSNSRIDVEKVDFVKIDVKENQNKTKYGDIFFTVSSETPNEVGMTSVLLNEVNNLYLNSFCFGFRLFDFESLKPEFAVFLFRFDDFRKEIVLLAQGSTRFNLSKAGVKKILLSLPELEEQTAIANVLKCSDTEIQLLKNKLAQFKEQKKGLMQVLLTGKKRLKIK